MAKQVHHLESTPKELASIWFHLMAVHSSREEAGELIRAQFGKDVDAQVCRLLSEAAVQTFGLLVLGH